MKNIFKILSILIILFAGIACSIPEYDEENTQQVAPQIPTEIPDDKTLDGDPVPSSIVPFPNWVSVQGNGNASDPINLQWEPVVIPAFIGSTDNPGENYSMTYSVYRSSDNGETFTRVTSSLTANSYSIQKTGAYLGGKEYIFAIKTFFNHKTNKSDVRSSSYSGGVVVMFLGTPSDVKITYLDNASDITIEFTEVPNASQYTFKRYACDSKGVIDDSKVVHSATRSVPFWADQIADTVGEDGVIPGVKYAYLIDVISANDGKLNEGTKAYYGMARSASAPPAVKNVTTKWSGYFADRIAIEWSLAPSITNYTLYTSRSTDATTFIDVKPANIASYPAPSYNKKFYVPTASEIETYDGKDYYFRVSGSSDTGDQGPLSEMTGTYFARLLQTPKNINIVPLEGKNAVSWDGDMNVFINRKLEDGTIQYLKADDTWVALADIDADTSSTFTFADVANLKKIRDGYYIDNTPVAKIENYAVASYADAAYNAGTEGHATANATLVALVQAHPYTDESLSGLPGLSDFVEGAFIDFSSINLNGVLTASDNLQSSDEAFGKIRLTMNLNSNVVKYLNALDLRVLRTYRYSGGYQGHNSTLTDKQTHTSLTNPNPANGDWEKTIVLEYEFPSEELYKGPYSVYDTMYDTDSNGNKYFAAKQTAFSLRGNVHPWYMRTEAEMAAQSAGNWKKILDIDGTPSEWEWHYLTWDWIVRKSFENKGNPSFVTGSHKDKAKSFDIDLMTRADYTVQLVSKFDESKKPVVESTNDIYGWPALTPREFAFMGMFFREVSFMKVGISYWDEIFQVGVSDVSTSDDHQSGWIDGTLSVTDAGFDLINLTINATVRAHSGSKNAVQDFPGVYMNMHWNPLRMMLGGEAKRSLDGKPLNMTTPRWSGALKLDAYVFGGTYYHGVDSRAKIMIDYSKFSSSSTLEQIYSGIGHADLGSFLVIHEYLSDGFSWQRTTSGVNATTYFDRYTSVGWSAAPKGGKTYPGF